MIEPLLSRTARWCLVLDGVLLLVLMLTLYPGMWEQFRPPVELPVGRIESDYPEEYHRLLLSVTRDGRVWRADQPMDAEGGARPRRERVRGCRRRSPRLVPLRAPAHRPGRALGIRA